MQYRFCLILFSILAFANGQAAAQLSKLDSLKKNIVLSTTTLQQIQATLAFCDMWESFNPDTLFKYASLARAKALSANDKIAVLKSDYYLAAYAFQKNKLDTALLAINGVIARSPNNIPYDISLKFWLLRGNILMRTTSFNDALQQNLEQLSIAEKRQDTIAMIRFSTSIGNVNMRLKKDSAALQWHYKALALMHSDELKSQCSFVYVNLAIVYYHLAVLDDTKQNEDSIEMNLQRSIAWARKGSSLTNVANSLSMYGSVLSEYKKLQPAEAALGEAIEIRKQIGDVYYEITDMLALAAFYENSKNYTKAIELCQQALTFAKENGSDFSSVNGIYSLLGEVYSAAGDYKNYSETLKDKMALQDSAYKANTAEAVAEMETKYEVEKKQATIAQQQYALVKKNYFVYGSLLLLLLVSIFSIILFRQNKKRQELKLKLLHEEEQRMRKIAVEAAGERERSRIAAELHDNLGAQLTYISSNMDFVINPPTALTELEKNKRLGRLNQTAKDTITDLRETIWALKKETVTLHELADRLKSYAQNQLSHKTNMKLHVNEQINVKLILSPAEALNTFRILQEAINNAIKYSSADVLDLSFIANDPGNYRICLTDNGKGFDNGEVYPGHYGLANMKERAGEIKAHLEIISSTDGGTQVSLNKRLE